jgi:hypothetical protein
MPMRLQLKACLVRYYLKVLQGNIVDTKHLDAAELAQPVKADDGNAAYMLLFNLGQLERMAIVMAPLM